MSENVNEVLVERSFEWDEDKNIINIKKHGISFRAAAYVFADVNRIEIYDELHSNDEDRYIVVGAVNKVLCVIYTERKNVTRIISARLATARERRMYYGEG